MSALLDPVDLCAQIESLRRQLDECRKDAERYRWLRSRNVNSDIINDMKILVLSTLYYEGSCIGHDYFKPEQLDAAIDAAMEKGK